MLLGIGNFRFFIVYAGRALLDLHAGSGVVANDDVAVLVNELDDLLGGLLVCSDESGSSVEIEDDSVEIDRVTLLESVGLASLASEGVFAVGIRGDALAVDVCALASSIEHKGDLTVGRADNLDLSGRLKFGAVAVLTISSILKGGGATERNEGRVR